jgi:ACS family hexuronate transporter-like MFS transporter
VKYESETNYRWVILSLLFIATTINYSNRIVLSVLIPEIKRELNINDISFGHIISAFQITYTLGFLAAGKFIDWIGTRWGYLLSIFFWSIAATMHSLCGTPFCIAAWRGILGFTESGNFPAAIKSVSEWFPIHERAFATSLFNSGASISSIIGPPIIVMIALAAGWRWAFFTFGMIGIVLALIWPFAYKMPKRNYDNVTNTNSLQKKYKWRLLLRYKETYGIMFGKFLTDPVWWFYLYWIPNYLDSQRGFHLKDIAIAVPLIYIIATLLGFVGGWFPGYLMQRGWSIGKARKTTMLICALLLPISATAVIVKNPWITILLVSLACSAHNGWSANIFTLVSDCFPSFAVGSVTGLAGFAGGLGGLLIATLAPGYIITYFGYIPIFFLMGILHPLAFVGITLLIRKVRVIDINNGMV